MIGAAHELEPAIGAVVLIAGLVAIGAGVITFAVIDASEAADRGTAATKQLTEAMLNEARHAAHHRAATGGR